MRSSSRFFSGVGIALALVLVMNLASPALASPLADKRAQAARVQAQIDALNTKVEIAAEAYDAAGYRLSKIDANVRANNAKLGKLQKRLGVLDKRLDTRAADMYRSGPLGILDVLFGSTSFVEFASNWDLMTQMSADDASLLASVKSVKAAAQATKVQLKNDQVAARAQVRARSQQRAAVELQLRQRRRLLAGVNSEIKTIIAQQAAAAAAAAAARARAAQLAAAAAARAARASASDPGGGGDSSGGGPGGSFPAPTVPAHGNVVDYARSRLGCPYEWGALGLVRSTARAWRCGATPGSASRCRTPRLRRSAAGSACRGRTCSLVTLCSSALPSTTWASTPAAGR